MFSNLFFFHVCVHSNWKEKLLPCYQHLKFFENIMKSCPCNEYPLKPHFYSKTGVCRVYLFFLFLLQSIDCGYSLEPPRRGGSNVYPQSMFGAKIRKISNFFYWKFPFFLQLKKSLYMYIAWASFRNEAVGIRGNTKQWHYENKPMQCRDTCQQ